MGGLLILALIIGYCYLVVFLIKKAPTVLKAPIIIGAILLVTADGIYGRYKLKKMCEAEGGVHIYETVDNVEGFEIEDSKLWMIETNNTYQYIEELRNTSSGKVDRLSFTDGKYYLERDVNSKSRYLVKTSHPVNTLKHYEILSDLIIDKKDNHILADRVYIFYYGGWATRFISSLYASTPSGKGCSQFMNIDMNAFEQLTDLITKTLKPIKQEK